MDNKSADKLKNKLLQISEFVAKLDPSIRAAAFDILRPQYLGETLPKNKVAPSGLTGLIQKYTHKKPADNVLLLAAWLYSSYGAYPITAKEVKELGDSCGLVIPGRADNTMRSAKKLGKYLFIHQGKGWKPTIVGELYLQETYNVKKGSKTLPKG